MLRLKAPGHERFFQIPDAGGHLWRRRGERGRLPGQLWRWTQHFLTVLPDNAIARRLRGASCVASAWIRAAHPARGEGRMGIYYLERRARTSCPSKVVYDRAWFCHRRMAKPGRHRLGQGVLQGVDWFHITGITPATQRERDGALAVDVRQGSEEARASPSPATSTTARTSGSTASRPARSCAR